MLGSPCAAESRLVCSPVARADRSCGGAGKGAGRGDSIARSSWLSSSCGRGWSRVQRASLCPLPAPIRIKPSFGCLDPAILPPVTACAARRTVVSPLNASFRRRCTPSPPAGRAREPAGHGRAGSFVIDGSGPDQRVDADGDAAQDRGLPPMLAPRSTRVGRNSCLRSMALRGLITLVNTQEGPQKTSSSRVMPLYTETLFWILTPLPMKVLLSTNTFWPKLQRSPMPGGGHDVGKNARCASPPLFGARIDDGGGVGEKRGDQTCRALYLPASRQRQPPTPRCSAMPRPSPGRGVLHRSRPPQPFAPPPLLMVRSHFSLDLQSSIFVTAHPAGRSGYVQDVQDSCSVVCKTIGTRVRISCQSCESCLNPGGLSSYQSPIPNLQ